MRWVRARRHFAVCTAALLLLGCASRGDRAWRHAAELWNERDPTAFAAWLKLDVATEAGQRAQTALNQADKEYRRGIELLSDGDDTNARALLQRATERAPINPALYLPMARACHRRGLDERAAAMYRKFLAAIPSDAEAEQARLELHALGDDIGAVFEAPRTESAGWPWWPALLVLVVVMATAAAVGMPRRRRTSLAALAAENPELQPAIAFLVGCLRHELLKHRIIAVGDAVRAVADGTLGESERRFLLARLYGGEPLAVAFAGHVGAFITSLGARFDLVRRDQAFIDAAHAFNAIASAEGSLSRGDAEAAHRVLAAHAELCAFDAALGQLTARLQYAVIDSALLATVVDDVKREIGNASVTIDLASPTGSIAVECYRFDLSLVLRNVLRNAVHAAAAGPTPARVAIAVDTVLEPTGDEIARIRVSDSNPSTVPAPAQMIEARGLALVRAALQRCDGSMSVEPTVGGFAKWVVIRLFCALHATEAAA